MPKIYSIFLLVLGRRKEHTRFLQLLLQREQQDFRGQKQYYLLIESFIVFLTKACQQDAFCTYGEGALFTFIVPQIRSNPFHLIVLLLLTISRWLGRFMY